MNKTFQIFCLICGKGKGGAFKGINHDKCAKALQEIAATKKKRVTTRRITDKSLDHFAGVGK